MKITRLRPSLEPLTQSASSSELANGFRWAVAAQEAIGITGAAKCKGVAGGLGRIGDMAVLHIYAGECQ